MGPLLLITAGVVLLALLSALALRRAASGEAVLTGTLTNVQQRDIGHASTLMLRTRDGRELRFVAHEQLNQTPGHLRDHMVFGEPVRVRYRRDGDVLIALQIDDAD